MSFNSLRIKVRDPSGQTKTVTCDGYDTFQIFLSRMCDLFGLTDPNAIEILIGFPPQLCKENSSQVVSGFLKTGDSVTIRQKTQLPSTTSSYSPPPIPSLTAATSTTTSVPSQTTSHETKVESWDCSACTFRNKGEVQQCEICETSKSGTTISSTGSSSEALYTGKRMAGAATALHASRHRIPDDNSCLFHAFIFLTNRRDTPQDLRNTIASAVLNDSVQWCDAILGRSRHSYIEFILDSSKWGGQVELNILSSIAHVEIAAIDIQTGRFDIYGQDLGYSQRVYMLFSGIHFDAIVFGDSATRVVRPDDMQAQRQAEALAASLKKQGDYTDQDTMQLVCQTCGILMNGDYEARRHAGSSGHVDFKMKKSY